MKTVYIWKHVDLYIVKYVFETHIIIAHQYNLYNDTDTASTYIREICIIGRGYSHYTMRYRLMYE